MLAVLTGPVRSGKSRLGLHLALASGAPVVIAVGASATDAEMARRIERHRAERPEGIEVIETSADTDWFDRVPPDACLLVDCLGSVLGQEMAGLVVDAPEVADADAEERAEDLADSLVRRLVARAGYTVVVTNEVGWGVVPATPLGRLFRDVLGRASKKLVDSADVAWLVIAGRCLDIRNLPEEVAWPST